MWVRRRPRRRFVELDCKADIAAIGRDLDRTTDGIREVFAVGLRLEVELVEW